PRSRGGAIDSSGVAMPPSLHPLWGCFRQTRSCCSGPYMVTDRTMLSGAETVDRYISPSFRIVDRCQTVSRSCGDPDC
ncbi:hypothetical protein A2U01_0053934, partial [Trifolium medium]|nr:hypothetical protein [Trifolium medium]